MAKDKRKMMQNRVKKMARAAARKSRRLQAAAASADRHKIKYGVSQAEIRAAPFGRVLVSRTIAEAGLGYVVVTRKLETGGLAAGVILLDAYCLGVKDAFFRVVSATELLDLMRRSGQTFEDASPSYACKLVRDAIAYARALGFEPHADYADTVPVFAGADPDACDTVFTFGKDGKPFYCSSPGQSMESARAVIAHLTARLGKDGFHYLIGEKLP